jgi:S1-C subfamily serine protease
VVSTLKYQNATAEGTGIVLTSNGLVLTNNHVLGGGATSVTATLVTSGHTYIADVVGYDSADDIALLQLENVSGLKTATLSDSDKAKVGEAVLALGNAGGRGGLPSTAQGTITALNQSIEASDSGTGTTEKLHGMIETNAPIQEGDSGGPLVNGSGAVVGIDTAANSSGYQPYSSATTGFSIPINRAMSIARQIESGKASTNVHIGLAGFIGVSVADASSRHPCRSNESPGFPSPVSSGAMICQVYSNTPAATANLAGGDVITSINGTGVASADSLTKLMADSHPGDQFSVDYVDRSDVRHSVTVTLSGWAT